MTHSLLKKGAKGPEVEKLERKLALLGYSPGPIDGNYDDWTKAAVEQFQRVHLGPDGTPMKVDGVVGPLETWPALDLYDDKTGVCRSREPKLIAVDVLTTGLLPDKVRKLLDAARRELGVEENPLGSNTGPRVDEYTGAWRVAPGKGPAWCALFVSFCIRTAFGQKLAFPPHKTRASVQKIREWGVENDRHFTDDTDKYAEEVSPGDIFLMLSKSGDGVDTGHGHTGFVLSVEGKDIRTVEGNCLHAVRSRLRPMASITGYVRVV